MSEDLTMLGAGFPRSRPGVSSVWRSYVPQFVVQTLLDHPEETPVASTEATDAVVIFADIVGFTPMSEALARAGSHGAEELTRILNAWFGSMADRILYYGGSVAEFAGDALIAVFCYQRRTRRATVRRAVQCALDMQRAMTDFQAVAQRHGTFGLAMKAGIGDGRLLLTIMGDPAVRLACLLAGRALDRASAAQRHARSGEVVVDDELVRGSLDIEVVHRRSRWFVVGRLRRAATPARPSEIGELDEAAVGRLAPFMHPTIAERLRYGRHELVNEHRRVTVAFVALAELAAEVPRSVVALQRLLAAITHVIARYDGHLHQVATGDKGAFLIIYFGAPVSHEDDEERAVRCCVELLRLPGGPLHAGVTTGFVYCGEIGSDYRRAYTVIGDSVNLAARLMQIAKAGQLLVDGATHERIRETVIQDRLEPLTVKGKAGPVAVWSVRAVREGTGMRSRTTARPEPLVARDLEVAKIETLVHRVRVGNGQILCITGEAGIGKSRLAAEAVRIAQELEYGVYGGACRSHGTNTSYLVWRSIWRDLLDLDTTRPLLEQQSELIARLERRPRTSGGRAPLLAPVLDLPMPDSTLTRSLDPKTRDELLRSLLLDCLRESAATGPLLLVLEDCHWIDTASDGLLRFLVRNLADQPVLIAVITRADTPSSLLASLSQLGWCSEIRLTELGPVDAERLVRHHLHRRYGAGARLAPDVVHQLVDRGEGNPFYLEELVSFLHGQGIDPGDRSSLAALDLPPGLQRLMMARIDQLTEAEKATVKVASVIGRRFRPAWISQSYPAAGTPEEVTRQLEHLAELDLTPRYATDPDPEYAFKHAITQDAAYQSLTLDTRQTLHERVGEVIEAAYPDRLAQYVDVLAHHYGRTERVDKQRVWYRAAGDAAKAAFANEAAVEYYERLLPLLPERETGEVLVELGAVWHLTGSWEQAEIAYRRAMEVAARAGSPVLLAASQRDLGTLFMEKSHAEAVTWLTRAAEEFDRLGDRRGLSSTLDHLTYTLIRQSSYTEALATAERHLALAAEANDLAGMSIALNHIGLVRASTGDTATALSLLEQALDMATRAGDQQRLIHATNNLAFVHFSHGDHRRAATYWQEALSVAQRIGFRQNIAVAIGNLGEVYYEQGDHAHATKCFSHALRIAAELGDWRHVAYRVASLAATAAAEGDDRAAERLFASAVDLARVLDVPFLLCYSLHHQARLYAAGGWLEEAALLNQEALELANQHSERDIQVRAELLSIRVQLMLGRTRKETAIERLRELRGVWTEPHERGALLDLLAELNPGSEATGEAAALYRTLYERTPSIEYRERYAHLTGVTLPPAPPLPPLPETVEEEIVDVEALLRQVDLATRQLGAA